MTVTVNRQKFAATALVLGFIDQRQYQQAIKSMGEQELLSTQEFFVALFDLTETQCEAIQNYDKCTVSREVDSPDFYATLSVRRNDRDIDTLEENDVHATLTQSGPLAPIEPVSDAITMRPAPGILSRYRVVRTHAQGGLGRVSIANDLELTRQVAIKELLDHYADDPATCKRFLAEARITGALEHPGVVPVYGLGTFSNGRPYYAMRFIQGISLKEAIDNCHHSESTAGELRFELRKLLGRFVAVCLAIEYAHSRQIIHRDLKPSNIMLGEYGETLVVDWGLAKSLVDKESVNLETNALAHAMPVAESLETRLGTIVGTPQFMSPEQANGRGDLVGAASDVYSLGATLYYLLTGCTPFPGTQAHEVLQQVRDGSFDPPRKLKPTLPKALEAICLKAMTLPIEERYSSAMALADDIEHFLADEPVSVYRESWSDRVTRWNRRHRAWFQALAMSALVIIGILSLAVFVVNGQRKQADLQRQRAEGLALEKSALAVEQQKLRHQAEWQSARRSLDQSLVLCGKDPAVGLLALVSNLEESLRINAEDLEESIRCQIAACSRRIHTLESANVMTDAIRDIVVHPDGKRYVVCFADQAPQWFTSDNSMDTDKWTPPDVGVQRGAFSPDGTLLATAGADNKIRLWDVVANTSVGAAGQATQEIAAIGFSGDGQLVLSASGNSVQIASVVNGLDKPLLAINSDTAFSDAVFSPVAHLVFTSDWSGDVRMWDANSGEQLGNSWPHSGPVVCLAINPQGTILAAGELGNRVSLWDVEQGKPVGPPLEHQGMLSQVCFSPDGHLLLTSSGDQLLRIWEVASGKLIYSPMRQTGMAVAAAFLGDNITAISGGADRVLRQWRVANNGAIVLDLGQNGNAIATSYCETDDCFMTVTSTLEGNGLLLPGELHCWQVASSRSVRPAIKNSKWGNIAAISRSGRLLCASLTDDANQAQLWNVAENRPLGKRLIHKQPIKSIVFSPDERWVISGSEDRTAQLWSAQSGEAVGDALLHADRVSSVEFLFANDHLATEPPNILTGSWDCSTRIWSIGQKESKPLWQKVHQGLVTTIAVSPDRTTFASATFDGEIRIWNAKTGQQIGSVINNQVRVQVMKFCGTQRLLAGAADGSLRHWDLQLRELIGDPMNHGTDTVALAVDPDGTWASVASSNWSSSQWPIGPWSDEPAAIVNRCMRMTNIKSMPDGSLVPLDVQEWSRLPIETSEMRSKNAAMGRDLRRSP
jgi:WD40 repeat protein/serine/threonine protein kinase